VQEDPENIVFTVKQRISVPVEIGDPRAIYYNYQVRADYDQFALITSDAKYSQNWDTAHDN